MTEREIRKFIEQVSPSPGFILNVTKTELSDLIYDLTGLELEQYEQNGSSNAKRLATLLSKVDELTSAKITTHLLRLKEDIL